MGQERTLDENHLVNQDRLSSFAISTTQFIAYNIWEKS